MFSPSRTAPRTIALSGLWVAGIGFFVTRFTVTLAIYDTRTEFLLAGVVPLVVGLLLATVGVAFVVGSFDPGFVRTVAVWCTAGTLAMAAMVLLTGTGSTAAGLDGSGSVRPATVLSNFLIGGAVLGALTGLYAGRNLGTRRKLRQQANQLVTINRILRHEVLNSVAVIRGWADPADGREFRREAADHVRREADAIVDTLDTVKHLSRTTRTATEGLIPVDLGEAVEASVAMARDRHPDVTFTVERDASADVRVWADHQLRHALYPLIENAAAHDDSGAPAVTVELAAGRDVACVRIRDTGPGLPARYRAILERGDIPDYDDPNAGFGTSVARMYVDGYGGDIGTEVAEDGTSVEVTLRSAPGFAAPPARAGSLGAVGVSRAKLLLAVGASVLAGLAMGAVVQVAAGIIPVIGTLYGVADPLVGWITHVFHSVVFGLVFAGLLTLLPGDYGSRLSGRLAVGVGWSLFLWLVAAGVVMQVWLNLVGVPRPVPALSPVSLGGHLVWGVVLGLSYHLGVDHLVGS